METLLSSIRVRGFFAAEFLLAMIYCFSLPVSVGRSLMRCCEGFFEDLWFVNLEEIPTLQLS